MLLSVHLLVDGQSPLVLIGFLVQGLDLFALLEAELALGDVAGHPPEHLYRLFDGLALLVLLEVALLENGDRVLSELYIREPASIYLHTHPPNFTAGFSLPQYHF